MKKTFKIFISVFLVILLLAVWYFGRNFLHIAYIGAGYKAKLLCSSVFVADRDPVDVLREELSDPRLKIIQHQIDFETKRVIATAPLGLVKRTAYYRPGLGATLDLSPKDLSLTLPEAQPPEAYWSTHWPQGDLVDLSHLPKEIDRALMDQAISDAFAEPDSQHLRRTRALIVVYQGQIIAERYAEGFTPRTRMLGWSMTKSVMNALIGILVGQGKLSIEQFALVPEWQSADDPRRAIQLDHLLHMTSGLEFDERYSSLFSDVVMMLYREKDVSKFAINKPVIHAPGSYWDYSSGTTNILSRIIRQTFAGDDRAYLEFPAKMLFHRIGMYSALIEPDAAGNLVGSSYMYATARDWARFGLLYLQDGIWEGQRILPEGWVQYSVKPLELAPNGKYGAHWWVGHHCLPIYDPTLAASLPQDLFSARGHNDQYVTIIPSKQLVIVRLGYTEQNNVWNQAELVARILKAIC